MVAPPPPPPSGWATAATARLKRNATRIAIPPRTAPLPIDAEQACYERYTTAAADMSSAKIRSWMHGLKNDFSARRQAIWLKAGPPSPRARPLVLGGGFGSTGTTSLAEALQRLGLVTWHASAGDLVHENSSTSSATIAPNDFRRSISAAWAAGADRCSKQLDALNYRLPPSVGALVDRPSAEAFLDFWWANPNALVLLTRRPALEWAKSRAKFGQAMNLPVDRPCRLSFADASIEELAQLLELHDELVRCCVVQP